MFLAMPVRVYSRALSSWKANTEPPAKRQVQGHAGRAITGCKSAIKVEEINKGLARMLIYFPTPPASASLLSPERRG